MHRDVKPENVLLDMQGPLGPGGAHPALLTDFGIARLVDSPRRTRATKVIGTPDYLAPEIIEGLPPRASVDVYALATVLYELLAGFTPFGGGHPGAVLRRHVTESVAPLPGIPDELWQLLLQCLAKAPASRLRAPELAARLREMLPGLAGHAAAGHRLADSEQPEDEQEGAAGSREEPYYPSAPPGEATPPRGAVPLVQGAVPDSNRETHTSMRVPGPDELAGGAHGTARAPRGAGERRAARPGTARRRMRCAAAGSSSARPPPRWPWRPAWAAGWPPATTRRATPHRASTSRNPVPRDAPPARRPGPETARRTGRRPARGVAYGPPGARRPPFPAGPTCRGRVTLTVVAVRLGAWQSSMYPKS